MTDKYEDVVKRIDERRQHILGWSQEIRRLQRCIKDEEAFMYREMNYLKELTEKEMKEMIPPAEDSIPAEAAPIKVRARKNMTRVSYVGAVPIYREINEALMKFLRAENREYERKEIIDIVGIPLGVTPVYIDSHLKFMMEKGYIERVGRGTYKCTSKKYMTTDHGNMIVEDETGNKGEEE